MHLFEAGTCSDTLRKQVNSYDEDYTSSNLSSVPFSLTNILRMPCQRLLWQGVPMSENPHLINRMIQRKSLAGQARSQENTAA